PEAVEDGKTGFLVPMYAAKPFADAIERLLENKDLRQQMSRAAQSHIREAHDLNKNYQKMETRLKTLAGRD
ncbi:MAG: glycosyltransferase, partial [Desulfobacterales bacterium]|nr:glycosyltransferase [Desulfobacterales bacterium]